MSELKYVSDFHLVEFEEFIILGIMDIFDANF